MFDLLKARSLRVRQARLPGFIDQIQAARLSYLGSDALLELAGAGASIERSKLPGLIVEAGCALRGSAIVMAGTKARARELRVF